MWRFGAMHEHKKRKELKRNGNHTRCALCPSAHQQQQHTSAHLRTINVCTNHIDGIAEKWPLNDNFYCNVSSMWYQLLTMIIINISSRNRSHNSSSRSRCRNSTYKFDKFRYACVIIHTHKTHIRISQCWYAGIECKEISISAIWLWWQLTNYRNCTHLHTLHMCLCMSIARNVCLSLCVYLFHSLIWFCVLERVWRRCFRIPHRFYYTEHTLTQPSNSSGLGATAAANATRDMKSFSGPDRKLYQHTSSRQRHTFRSIADGTRCVLWHRPSRLRILCITLTRSFCDCVCVSLF